MGNDKLFSQYYSTDTNKYEDKEKFRARALKYLEDFINSGFSGVTYYRCRSALGIDILKSPHHRIPDRYHFDVEKTFHQLQISDILDFISITYDSQKEEYIKSNMGLERINSYVNEINRIFSEESMCYIFNDNGRVRYYPDEEFHKSVNGTIILLNREKYSNYLKIFDELLDGLYKNREKESPIRDIFDCVENFILSSINEKNEKILRKSSIDKYMNLVEGHCRKDNIYTTDDVDVILNYNELFQKWVSMCHKYRHGKQNQENKNVPKELFNFLLSSGISIFRFLLEIDHKYNIMK